MRQTDLDQDKLPYPVNNLIFKINANDIKSPQLNQGLQGGALKIPATRVRKLVNGFIGDLPIVQAPEDIKKQLELIL